VDRARRRGGMEPGGIELADNAVQPVGFGRAAVEPGSSVQGDGGLVQRRPEVRGHQIAFSGRPGIELRFSVAGYGRSQGRQVGEIERPTGEADVEAIHQSGFAEAPGDDYPPRELAQFGMDAEGIEPDLFGGEAAPSLYRKPAAAARRLNREAERFDRRQRGVAQAEIAGRQVETAYPGDGVG